MGNDSPLTVAERLREDVPSRRVCCMRRDLLIISEMLAAAEQAQSLVADADLGALGDDRQRRDALL